MEFCPHRVLLERRNSVNGILTITETWQTIVTWVPCAAATEGGNAFLRGVLPSAEANIIWKCRRVIAH
jgi:hypothetical protein